MLNPSPKVKAIVVGHLNYGEADRVVKVLSAEHGLISAMARGARASKRNGGAIDLGNLLETSLVRSQGSLWKIHQPTLIDGRQNLRKSLYKLALMAYFSEICSLLAQPEQPEPKFYGMLEASLAQLGEEGAEPAASYRIAFELKALAYAGLMPNLRHCQRCDGPAVGRLVLVPSEGGLYHTACRNGRSGQVEVQAEWLAQADRCLRSPMRDSLGGRMSQGPGWVFSEMIEQHCESGLRSRPFLMSLEKS